METTTRETAFQIKKKEKKIATETERQMNLGDTKKRKQAKKVPFFFWSFLSFTSIHSSGLLKYLYLVYVTTKPTRQAKVLVPITKRILLRLHRMRFPLRLV